ncbi:hypothetical protein P3383_23775, partial [Vibrio parahaemolyticus]|nr:hypothetical protein [Vibrio parahaemolyticus]
TGSSPSNTELASVTAEENAVNVYILCCHKHEHLVHEQMHASFCAVIQLAGAVWQKENSPYMKLPTARYMDYLE